MQNHLNKGYEFINFHFSESNGEMIGEQRQPYITKTNQYLTLSRTYPLTTEAKRTLGISELITTDKTSPRHTDGRASSMDHVSWPQR